jgi:hypothetical protein
MPSGYKSGRGPKKQGRWSSDSRTSTRGRGGQTKRSNPDNDKPATDNKTGKPRPSRKWWQ